jgi:hypothetical protein
MPILNTYKVVNYNDPTNIYAHPDGVDDNNGSFHKPVRSITRAMALVDATRLTVICAPGDYEEAATVTWPTRKGVRLIGSGASVTTISAPTSTTGIITVAPGVQASSFTGHLEGFEIVHDEVADIDGITFSNAAMTKKLGFNIKNCTFSPDSETDKSIHVETHSDSGNSIRIYVSGDGCQSEIGGAIYFNFNNNADRLHLENCWIIGTITTSSTALEGRIRLFKCIVPHNGATAGGNALQYITAVDCFSWIDYDDLTPEIYAQLDSSELTGSHSEVIVD